MKDVLDEFKRLAYWDGYKKAWCYREDRHDGDFKHRYVMKRKGDIILGVSSHGYRNICINYKNHQIHRLAYMIYNNVLIDSKTSIDHVNGIRSDNSKDNLRIATNKQNSANSKKINNCSSPYKGVCWDKNRDKWRVSICVDKIPKNLGRFDSELDAAKTYNVAAVEYFGKYAKLNVL